MSYLRFRDQLVNANRHDLFPPKWLDTQVAKGLLVPIVGEQSAALAGVRFYPSGMRVGHIPAAVGDLEELRDIIEPRAIEWAQQQGCRMAMLEGRPGWARALNGWDHHQSVLLREI